MELKKIGVLSLGKIGAFIGFLFGIVGAIYFTILKSTGLIDLAQLEQGIGAEAFSWGVILMIPISYLISGFVFGILVAGFYNIVARKIGGVKLDFAESKAIKSAKKVTKKKIQSHL